MSTHDAVLLTAAVTFVVSCAGSYLAVKLWQRRHPDK